MPPDELTGTEPRHNLWLSQEDAELLAMVVARSGKIWDKPVRLFTTRTLTYSRLPRPAQRVHVRTGGPRRRRVTSGPRKARAPDDPSRDLDRSHRVGGVCGAKGAKDALNAMNIQSHIRRTSLPGGAR
jgi:hypothetical protein